MKVWIIFWLFPVLALAQSDKAKVDSINTHFYEIYSSDFDQAKTLVNEAIALAAKNGWPNEEALAQKNLGIILYLRGEYENALPAYLRSYELFDSLKNYRGLGQLANEMANYFRKQYGESQGFQYLDSAEKWSKMSGDLRTLGTSYGMRATFHRLLEQYDSSKQYYLKCYDIRVQQKDSVGLGYIYLDLADMAHRDGQTGTAIEYFNKSLEIRKAVKDEQGLLESIYALGEFYFKEGQFAKALDHFNQCADGSHEFHHPDLRLNALEYVSDCLFSLDRYREAYLAQRETQFLKDSLFNLDRSRIITELRTQYETEKKEQQIDIQEAQLAEQAAQLSLNLILIIGLVLVIIMIIVVTLLIRSRTKKKQELLLKAAELQLKEVQIASAITSQEQERKRFARDLHDGFGQFISVLNLNLKSLEKGVKDPTEVFESSAEVLDQMYRELKGICFNLMPETLIKQGIVNGIKEFSDRINVTGKVSIEVDTFEMDDRLEDLKEISLYRITQEWVNNILKYSNATKINIQLTRDESEITLMIEDNGNGFDQSLLTSGKGNGWKNLNSRANLIKGELELDTTVGIKGSTLILNCPVKQAQEQVCLV
ncbi:MAG: tetratricopeptide repeat protein [Cyclobacteriaceae bacterium]